jgi:glycosyltransferase involved in cell wall biosynthesis
MIHCEQNTGYAIEKLEKVFLKSAFQAGYSAENIYWSYSKVSNPTDRVYALDFHGTNFENDLNSILKKLSFDVILAFDLPFPSNVIPIAKRNGVRKVISYWGASMSSINSGVKLALKKIEHMMRSNKSADTYIFESQAMQLTATHGRGIPKERTTVIPLGVDTSEYFPSNVNEYIHENLNIPLNRKVIFYSGHMEERKGVRTIIRAALEMESAGKLDNIHFVLCGNKGSEADSYLDELKNSEALNHVTFAGYRDDIPQLMRSSDIGVIASTGWDSFTRSSIELLASGIPLIASNLGGLAETTKHEETGYLIEPGNHQELMKRIIELTDDDDLRAKMSLNALTRVENFFTELEQIKKISNTLVA